jgi:DnaJ-class molecular chaperone
MTTEATPGALGSNDKLGPDAEACDCDECEGQGRYDVWKAVAGHYEGGEYFRMTCDHCDGTGKRPNVEVSGPPCGSA